MSLFSKATPKLVSLMSIQKYGVISRLYSKNIINSMENKIHFKNSSSKHPLKPIMGSVDYDKELGDHTGRQQNHIWSKEEIDLLSKTLYRHKPVTISDKIVNASMYGLYHSFNFITRYDEKNPSVNAIEWRLIVLESIAGVPGFVAAGFRHFRSLRTLDRDHGWIATLLEEAENERMHLLTCLQVFEASKLTRAIVIAAQCVMTPILMSVYLVNPKSMHRFVGYLEETACHTYANILQKIDQPGTHLNKGWDKTLAPAMAIGYWKLSEDALWKDVLGCIMADECHHRDVNHTFADMKSDDPNPFLHEHKENALIAWRINNDGEKVVEKNHN
jgi:hypothetical protein